MKFQILLRIVHTQPVQSGEIVREDITITNCVHGSISTDDKNMFYRCSIILFAVTVELYQCNIEYRQAICSHTQW
jgi:hypothetical protein